MLNSYPLPFIVFPPNHKLSKIGKWCPVTCQAGTDGRYRYNSTHPNLGARRRWVIYATPQMLHPRE